MLSNSSLVLILSNLMCYTFRLRDTYESIKNRCSGIDDENEDNEGEEDYEDFDYFFHKRVRETYEGEEKVIAKRAVKDADHYEEIARKEFEMLIRKDMERGIEMLEKGIETLCELFHHQHINLYTKYKVWPLIR